MSSLKFPQSVCVVEGNTGNLLFCSRVVPCAFGKRPLLKTKQQELSLQEAKTWCLKVYEHIHCFWHGLPASIQDQILLWKQWDVCGRSSNTLHVSQHTENIIPTVQYFQDLTVDSGQAKGCCILCSFACSAPNNHLNFGRKSLKKWVLSKKQNLFSNSKHN